jgi:hypothetical protein
MRRTPLCCLIFLMLPLGQAQVLPTEFVRDRIFVLARAADGSTVRFFTDTGGGWNALSAGAQQRLRLPQKGDAALDDGRAPLVDPTELFRRSKLPLPTRDESWLRGMLIVAPDGGFMDSDGTLGSRWFAAHVWDIDYSRRRMSEIRSIPGGESFEEVALGFATDDQGRRALNFPRITVRIDGESIDVLLDTGASARLSTRAAAVLGDHAGVDVGTSFIIRSILERWRTAHPDWSVIPAADDRGGQRMIEVPAVRIGGVEVGPVWFTERPDANFVEMMSQMTDRTVRGALGGSALKYLRVVLDYPGAKMYVQRHATRK